MNGAIHHGLRRFGAMWRLWPFYTTAMLPWLSALDPYASVARYAFMPVLQVTVGLGLAQLARGVVVGPGGAQVETWALPSLPLGRRARRVGESLAAALGVMTYAALAAVVFVVVAPLARGVELVSLARWFLGAIPVVVVVGLTPALTSLRAFIPAVLMGLVQAVLVHQLGDTVQGAALVAGGLLALLAVAEGLGWLDRPEATRPAPKPWNGPLHAPPRPPRTQLARQWHQGLLLDALPGAGIGLGFATIFIGLSLYGEWSWSSWVLFDAFNAALLGAALMTPLSRRGLPMRATIHGAVTAYGFVEAYRVLPLPRWLVLRGLVGASAAVYLLFASVSGLLMLLAHQLLGYTSPSLLLLLLTMWFAPLSWSAMVSLGLRRPWQMLLVVGLGLGGGVLALPRVFTDAPWDAQRVGLLTLGIVLALAGLLLPLGGLRAPRRASHAAPPASSA